MTMVSVPTTWRRDAVTFINMVKTNDITASPKIILHYCYCDDIKIKPRPMWCSIM